MCYVVMSSVACLSLPYFPTWFHKRHDFREKKVIEHGMCVLIFSTTSVWKSYHSKKHAARYHKYTYVATASTHNSCQILMKLESSGQIFEKCSNVKFHENPSSENRVFPCWKTGRRRNGRTDRETDTPKQIIAVLQFCERMYKGCNTFCIISCNFTSQPGCQVH